MITKSFGDGLDLVDMQPLNPDEARVLLSHIAMESLERKITHLYCWAPTYHSVHGILERLGFENSGPVTYFGGRELNRASMPADWLDYRRWYFQMGDSDVY